MSKEAAAAATPPPFYYLDNFSRALDWLARRYDDLLDADERAFMAAFTALPQPSRALLVRMLMRRGPYLRESRLDYAEIGSIKAALAPLIAGGFVDAAPLLALDDVVELLTLPELVRAFALPKGTRKTGLADALRADYPGERSIAAWAPELDERALLLPVAALCERLRILFFGNAYQDWSEFVLADLGIFRYESVKFSPAARAFRVRAEFDAYLQLLEARARLDAGEDLLDIAAAVPAAAYDNAWLETRRARLLFALAQQAERDGQREDALLLYRRSSAAEAPVRAVRMLELLGRNAEAHEMALATLQTAGEAERQALERMLPRLARALGLPRPAKPVRAALAEIEIHVPWCEDGVEEAARRHFDAPDAPAVYVENALVNSLFGLLCWDAIFLDVPGAFFHPFQAGPADLHAADFHLRRRDAFDACLGLLDDDRWRDAIRANWRAKHGIVSPFVFWGALDEEVLEMALACIPAQHLRRWCERLLADVKGNRSGFPDLVQFWPQEQRYRFIEVKGPGDRLQDNQLRLLHDCVAHGMPVLVCYLRWQEDE